LEDDPAIASFVLLCSGQNVHRERPGNDRKMTGTGRGSGTPGKGQGPATLLHGVARPHA